MSDDSLRYEYFSAPNDAFWRDKLVVTVTRGRDGIHFIAKTYKGEQGMAECPMGEAAPDLIEKLNELHSAWQAQGCAFESRPTISANIGDGKEVRIMGVHDTRTGPHLHADPLAYERATLGKIHDVAMQTGMHFTNAPNALGHSMVKRELDRLKNRDQNPDNLQSLR